MHLKSVVFAAFTLAVLSSSAQAVSITFGNYQGGIIPWSPEVKDREYRAAIQQAAMDHCAWYNRVAYLTGVVAGYGNYISFTCKFARNYDPVKAGAFHWPF